MSVQRSEIIYVTVYSIYIIDLKDISKLQSIKVLIVEDTILYRKIIGDVLAQIPGVEVVGSANNGKIALSRIASLKPDLLTLDIEMPVMDGIEVLSTIRKNSLPVDAIVVTTLTKDGSDMTIRALELNAFDFISKPQTGTMIENKLAIKKALTPIILEFQKRKQRNRLQPFNKRDERVNIVQKLPTPVRSPVRHSIGNSNKRSNIIAIGISTGGPSALSKMMPSLPNNIGVPIVIVQHMPPMFTKSLSKSLNAKCAVNVKEAEDKECLKPNTAYIAPGGKQMKIILSGDGKNKIIKITNDPPENGCKPSADYLFKSVAEHFTGKATGVIMTGMGSDGTAGLKLMKDAGATIIAQNEATCTIYGMPKKPIEMGITDIISPLNSIASEIVKTVKKTG